MTAFLEASASPSVWSAGTVPPPPYPQFQEVYEADPAHPEAGGAFDGRREDLLLRPGVLMMIRDGVTRRDLTGWREVGPALHLGLMLEGTGHTVLEDGGAPFLHPVNRLSLQATDRPLRADVFLPAGTVLRYLDIRIALPVLAPLLQDLPLSAPRAAVAFPDLAALGVRLSLLPVPPGVRRLVAQILATDCRTPYARLYLDGKVQELLALALALEAHQRPLDHPPPATARKSLTPADRRRLTEARALLLADLETTWAVRDLARQVGLNETKLKTGFRDLFGSSVYACLQDHRMRAAAALLARGEDSVTGVALAVGYANPAHFARLFRRYYGVSPSRYAADPDSVSANESQKRPDPTHSAPDPVG